MTTPEERAFPFSNGSERMDWKGQNCECCSKGYDDIGRAWRCVLERAIDDAGWAKDGCMPMDKAQRVGWVEKPYGHLEHKCKEFDRG